MNRDNNGILEKWLKTTNRSIKRNNSIPTRKINISNPRLSLDLDIGEAYYENTSSEDEIEPPNFPIRFQPRKTSVRPLSLPAIDLTKVTSPN